MKTRMVLVAVCMLFVLTAFIPDNTEEPFRIAENIWEEIQNYTDWQLVPGGQLMMPSQAPHGKFVTIYANSVALSTLRNNKFRMPNGAIYSKENFDSNKILNKITVMKKIESHWFWAVYKPDGVVEKAGEIKGCIACHAGARKDNVFTWK